MQHGFRGGSHKNTPRAGNEKVLEVEATRRGRGDDADDLVTMAATRMVRIRGAIVQIGLLANRAVCVYKSLHTLRHFNG